MDSEGGDDIMIGSEGSDRFEGRFGFDWVTYRGVNVPAVADMQNEVFQPPDMLNFRSRFDLVEGLSGWNNDDILRGYNRIDDLTIADGTGHELTEEHLDRIFNLRAPGRRAHRAPCCTVHDDQPRQQHSSGWRRWRHHQGSWREQLHRRQRLDERPAGAQRRAA